jgi:hypothetical protein
MMFISSSTKLVVKVDKSMNLFVRVCHGRFHDVLLKGYSGTFYELHGKDEIAIKRDVLTNNKSQPYFVIEKTNFNCTK